MVSFTIHGLQVELECSSWTVKLVIRLYGAFHQESRLAYVSLLIFTRSLLETKDSIGSGSDNHAAFESIL